MPDPADLDAVPTSFGTLKPVGHVLLALPDAHAEDAVAIALHEAGIGGVRRIAPRETAQEMQQLIDEASAAAGFGYEIVLMKRYVDLAARGCRWLLVKVDGTEQAAKVAELARGHGALSAVHYRRLVEEDLI